MGRGGSIDDLLLLTSEEYIYLQDSIVKNKYHYEYQGMHVEYALPKVVDLVIVKIINYRF